MTGLAYEPKQFFWLALMPLLALFVALGAFAEPSNAQSAALDAVEAEYIQGNYARAVELGRSLGSAEGLALAARAGLVIARFQSPPLTRDAEIAAALVDALAALALSPNHVEAHLQAAIAYGYRGKRARSIRDAKRGRRHIDQALAENQNNAWAAASLGGWHGEVVLEAGPFFARILFGARRSLAVLNFERAVKLDPGNVLISVGFGTTLLRFDKPEYEARAIVMLRASLEYAARNALDELLQTQARELIKAYESGDRKLLRKELDRTSSFSDD